jgi:tight adherence protein C
MDALIPFIPLLAALMMALAVSLFAVNLMPAGMRTLSMRGAQVSRVDPSRLPSLWFKVLFPLLDALSPLFKRVGWARYRAKAARELQRAAMGEIVTVDHLLAMKVLTAVVIPLLAVVFFPVLKNPALFAGVAIGAFFIPDKMVSSARKAREQKVVRTLPGAVDVLSLSVEAGLEFLIALQRLVERGTAGPLRDELSTVLNDTRLGKSRTEALKAFAQRIEVPEVSSFVSVLVQADMLGASIGPVLQQQAERMRVERFQRAEKAGAQATQKILFPMIFFIFPAVLMVILAPVALKFMQGY